MMYDQDVKDDSGREEKHPKPNVTEVAVIEDVSRTLKSYLDYCAKDYKQYAVLNRYKNNLYATVATAALTNVLEDEESFAHVFKQLFCSETPEDSVFAVGAEYVRTQFMAYDSDWSILDLWQERMLREVARFERHADPKLLSPYDNETDLQLKIMSRLLTLHIIIFYPAGVRKDYGVEHHTQIILVQQQTNQYTYLSQRVLSQQQVPFDLEKYQAPEPKPKLEPQKMQIHTNLFGLLFNRQANDSQTKIFEFLSKSDLYRIRSVNKEWRSLSQEVLLNDPTRADFKKLATELALLKFHPLYTLCLQKVFAEKPTLYHNIAAFTGLFTQFLLSLPSITATPDANQAKLHSVTNSTTVEDSTDKSAAQQQPLTKKPNAEINQERYQVILWTIRGQFVELNAFLTQNPNFDCNFLDSFLPPLAWANLYGRDDITTLLQSRGATFLPQSLRHHSFQYARRGIEALAKTASHFHSPILVETIIAGVAHDLSVAECNQLLVYAFEQGVSKNLPLETVIVRLRERVANDDRDKKEDAPIKEVTLSAALLRALKMTKPENFGHHSLNIIKSWLAQPNFPTENDDYSEHCELLFNFAQYGQPMLACFVEKHPNLVRYLEGDKRVLAKAAGNPGGLIYLLENHAQELQGHDLDRRSIYTLLSLQGRSACTYTLIYSARQCYVDFCKVVQYASKKGWFFPDSQGDSLFLRAAEAHHYDVLEQLRQEEKCEGLIDQINGQGNTALHLAIADWPTVHVLLKFKGINVNAVNGLGQTPLHRLLSHLPNEGYCGERIFTALMSYGADLTLKDWEHKTPLDRIVRLSPSWQDSFLCKILPYIDVNNLLIKGIPLLHYAIVNQLSQTVQALALDKRVSINLVYEGYTPLAAAMAAVYMYDILRRTFTNLPRESETRHSPKFKAIIQQLLKRKDLDIDEKCEDKRMMHALLHQPYSYGDTQILKLLLAHPRFDLAKHDPKGDWTGGFLCSMSVSPDKAVKYRGLMISLLWQRRFTLIPPQAISGLFFHELTDPSTLLALAESKDSEVMALALIHPNTDIRFLQNKRGYDQLCRAISAELGNGTDVARFAITALRIRVLLAEAKQALTRNDFAVCSSKLEQAVTQDRGQSYLYLERTVGEQVHLYIQQMVDSQANNYPFHGTHRLDERQISQLLQMHAAMLVAKGLQNCSNLSHLLWMGQQFETGFYVKQDLVLAHRFYQQAYLSFPPDYDSKKKAAAENAMQNCQRKMPVKESSQVSSAVNAPSQSSAPSLSRPSVATSSDTSLSAAKSTSTSESTNTSASSGSSEFKMQLKFSC